MTGRVNKWQVIRENSAYPDYYAGMTKTEQMNHERWLDRKVNQHQRNFWRRARFIRLSGTTKDRATLAYQLLDANRKLIATTKWTPCVAYSIAREYGMKPIPA